MTTAKARVLETDAVIFSTDLITDNLKNDAEMQTAAQIKLEEETNKIKTESRFARLKKSLRKKSVSIL